MTTFACISEGITDQIVIENILIGFFKSYDLELNPLQPLRDETDRNKQKEFGNWFNIFEYIRSDKFRGALQFNDYVIIQIDTDVCEELHYDVSKLDDSGKRLPPETLVEKVEERLRSEIGEQVYNRFKDRIIFAICVESLECWLLPLVLKDNRKWTKIENCFEYIQRELRKEKGKNKISLAGKDGSKNPEGYENISKAFRKNKDLKKQCSYNKSFNIFLESIAKRNIVVDD